MKRSIIHLIVEAGKKVENWGNCFGETSLSVQKKCIPCHFWAFSASFLSFFFSLNLWPIDVYFEMLSSHLKKKLIKIGQLGTEISHFRRMLGRHLGSYTNLKVVLRTKTTFFHLEWLFEVAISNEEIVDFHRIHRTTLLPELLRISLLLEDFTARFKDEVSRGLFVTIVGLLARTWINSFRPRPLMHLPSSDLN